MYTIPNLLVEKMHLDLDFDPKFYTKTSINGELRDVYTKNIIITGSPRSFVAFVNALIFLVNEFVDRIDLSQIAGVSFSNSIKDLQIQLEASISYEEGTIAETDGVFTWAISERNLVLLMPRPSTNSATTPNTYTYAETGQLRSTVKSTTVIGRVWRTLAD